VADDVADAALLAPLAAEPVLAAAAAAATPAKVPALVLAAIVPMIQWQADIAACVRILGLDEAYCADYLRLIRE
jgi:hypothetical protein